MWLIIGPDTCLSLPALAAQLRAQLPQLCVAAARRCGHVGALLLELAVHSSDVSASSLAALSQRCPLLRALRLGGIGGYAHQDTCRWLPRGRFVLDFPRLEALVCPVPFGRQVDAELRCPLLRAALISRLLPGLPEVGVFPLRAVRVRAAPRRRDGSQIATAACCSSGGGRRGPAGTARLA